MRNDDIGSVSLPDKNKINFLANLKEFKWNFHLLQSTTEKWKEKEEFSYHSIHITHKLNVSWGIFSIWTLTWFSIFIDKLNISIVISERVRPNLANVVISLQRIKIKKKKKNNYKDAKTNFLFSTWAPKRKEKFSSHAQSLLQNMQYKYTTQFSDWLSRLIAIIFLFIGLFKITLAIHFVST